MTLAGMICALIGYKDLVNNLSNFLDVLLSVFIPWSAINLADYYLIKHGDYDVKSFFTPNGIYGGFLWHGLIPYALAIAAEIPFIDQTFYTGPLVKPLGGVDISWVTGGVAGFVFYMIAMAIPINGRPRSADQSPIRRSSRRPGSRSPPIEPAAGAPSAELATATRLPATRPRSPRPGRSPRRV